MPTTKVALAQPASPRGRRRSGKGRRPALTGATPPALASVLEEARRAGLLTGDRTEHISFRAPPALLEAARRETGINSMSELGVLALAMLARPDPVVAFFRRTEGRLGPDHDLEH